VTFGDSWRRLGNQGALADDARNQASMARVLWLLLAAGGVLALTILVLPHPETLNERGFAGLAIVSLLSAGAVWRKGPSLPIPAAQAFCALGTVIITLSIYWSGEELGSVAENELLYLWPILFAGYFFNRRALAVQVGIFIVLYGLCMLSIDTGGDATARWIVTTAGLSVAAAFVGYLRDRIAYEFSLQRATIESTTDGILVVDSNGRWESFNRKFLTMWRIPGQITGSRDDDAALEFVLDQLEDPAQFLAKVRELYEEPAAESYDVLAFKDGRVLERYSLPQQIGGRVVGRVWSFRDITDRRRADERLQHLADHDPLTDLFNRRTFEEDLTRELARAARYGNGGALLLLDLDNFKGVNDTYGHIWGDEVLRGTARLLSSRLRSTDVLARLGGDEFAVLLPQADEVRAVMLAEELLEVTRSHVFETEHGPLKMTTSLGVVALDALDGSSIEPMAAADTAMYRAKHDGRDRLAVFEPARDGTPHGPAGYSRRQA
jgi:diguanylate cyclase (GGDEF)-like protein/PAS domain S-box-containing protein